MSAQHTPGPWHTTPPDASYHDVVRIYAEGDAEGSLPIAVCPQRAGNFQRVLAGETDKDGETLANAAFIVRAVNAHDELVAALERAAEALELARCGVVPSMESVDAARAALEKAKVQP